MAAPEPGQPKRVKALKNVRTPMILPPPPGDRKVAFSKLERLACSYRLQLRFPAQTLCFRELIERRHQDGLVRHSRETGAGGDRDPLGQTFCDQRLLVRQASRRKLCKKASARRVS